MLNKEQLDNIKEKSAVGLWSIEIEDGKAPRMYADDSMLKLLGTPEGSTPEEVFSSWYDNIHPDFIDTVNTGVDHMKDGSHIELKYPWYHPVLGKTYVRCSGIRDYSYPDGIRILGCHQDVADIIRYHVDTLTGLYTFEFFCKRVDEIRAANPDKEYTIVVSDVENFKVINDKYGFEVGDQILYYLASAGKNNPNFIISGRLNGDIFVHFEERKPDEITDEELQMARDIIKDAPVPGIVWKHGVCHIKKDEDVSTAVLCDRARMAVESIKGEYGADIAIYSDDLEKKQLIKNLIVDNMEDAIANEQFKVYLQPKHNLHTDKTGGAEALVRWIHPVYGFMNPGEFISEFEHNGFIKKLDRYILEHVCQIIASWNEKGMPVVPISVNFSRRDFEDEFLAEKIVAITDKYGVDHSLIHIELTETTFIDDPERISVIIDKLHKAGFVIELDDFGKGYSSLITLNELELDIIKLDMSLVQNDDKHKKDKSALDFCAQLIKMLNLSSVAEGVETEAQVERIRELGCDYIQGYVYSRPLPQADFEEYLGKEK